MNYLKTITTKNFLLTGLFTAVVATPLFSQAVKASSIRYDFIGVVDELSDKKVDAADYGFSTGNILTGTLIIDDDHPDTDSNSAIGKYKEPNINFLFSISSSAGTLLYSDGNIADDITVKIENNHGSSSNPHDKFEIDDKSLRDAITPSGSGASIDFEKLVLKLEDDDNADAFNTTIPAAYPALDISNFVKKHEFEVKFKSSGKEVKLKGDVSAFSSSVVSAIPIPAAAWFFGSAILGLFGLKRKV
ncbi:hypothetical protein [Oceanicoccus sagamiensis]|uniref:PEP-CTERM sorting domain-containing protein n=1 Tax=Oceanicoccus sagamiensis TaxID=716816 RepID=A0A1X9NCY9_9GAMM|nr:hypothetical protein [Oceanicoccus sagamiensis]ARN74282.1 hypothetical protein BST96_09195 [Oceanicoccus sagamiensis]